MHEPFDDELRERLQQYTEEPNKNLWEGIAPHVAFSTKSSWVVWPQRTSALVVSTIFMVLVLRYDTFEMKSYESSIDLQQNQKNNSATEQISGIEQKDESKIVSTKPTIRKSNKESLPTGIDSQRSEVEPIINRAVPGVPVEDRKEVEEAFSFSIANSGLNLSRSSATWHTELDTIEIKNEIDSLKTKQGVRKKSNRKPQRHRSYTMYFTAMPTFGYQRVEPNQNDNIIIESIKKLPAFSTQRLGLRVELGAEFPITKRVKIFGGVLYYQRKQTIDYTEKNLDSAIFTSGPNGELIIEPQFSFLEKSVEHELQNVGAQVGFVYKLSGEKKTPLNEKQALTSSTMQPKKKLVHLLGTGLEFHKAINGTNEFNKANGFSNPSAYVFFNMFYRLQYPNEGRLRAIFQPTLNYSFYINENLNAPFYVKPYGLGLNFGCTYNF